MRTRAGSWRCIGKRFATMELQLVVATLLARLDPELESDPEFAPGVTLQPANPVRMRFERRYRVRRSFERRKPRRTVVQRS